MGQNFRIQKGKRVKGSGGRDFQLARFTRGNADMAGTPLFFLVPVFSFNQYVVDDELATSTCTLQDTLLINSALDATNKAFQNWQDCFIRQSM